jgi:hypothetical protein
MKKKNKYELKKISDLPWRYICILLKIVIAITFLTCMAIPLFIIKKKMVLKVQFCL